MGNGTIHLTVYEVLDDLDDLSISMSPDRSSDDVRPRRGYGQENHLQASSGISQAQWYKQKWNRSREARHQSSKLVAYKKNIDQELDDDLDEGR